MGSKPSQNRQQLIIPCLHHMNGPCNVFLLTRQKKLERHCKDSWNAHQGWASSDQFPDSKARGFWSDLEHKWTIQLFRSVKYQKTDRSLHKLHKFKNSTICLSQNVKTCMSPGSTTCAIKPYGITQKFPPDHRPWDPSPQEGNSLPIEVVV